MRPDPPPRLVLFVVPAALALAATPPTPIPASLEQDRPKGFGFGFSREMEHGVPKEDPSKREPLGVWQVPTGEGCSPGESHRPQRLHPLPLAVLPALSGLVLG